MAGFGRHLRFGDLAFGHFLPEKSPLRYFGSAMRLAKRYSTAAKANGKYTIPSSTLMSELQRM
jgi:hypothetical protein